MKPFNLAEERIAERVYCKQQVNRRLKIMAGLIALTLLVAAGSFGCRMSVAGKSTELKTQLAEVQNRCLQVKRKMGGVKTTSSQRKWQEGLTAASGQWLNLLDEILRCLPTDAWMEKIENSTQSQTLMIDGHAASYESLALFINRLKGIKEFTEVRISGTSVNTTRDGTFVDFSIQAKMNTPSVDPAAPAANQPAVLPALQESAG